MVIDIYAFVVACVSSIAFKNETLRITRDLLLPKLILREIEV